MTTRPRLLACLLALSAAGCGDAPATDVDSGTTPGTDSGPTPTDSGTPVDGAIPGDDASTPTDSGTPTDGGPGPTCGGARPDISGITGTEGLVIARDGTIYYSQRGGVGRLTPGGSPQSNWVRLTSASATVWGLALDAANETLYFGSPSTGSVHRVDLTAASPSATVFVSGAGAPNGLTIGPDGALYFSDFGGDAVYRVDTSGPTGTPVEVTTSAIASANGVAFLADGTLLVASYSSGRLHRLTLTAGVESARATFAMGVGSPDGIAVDADGRVYVTDNGGGRVIRLEPDGSGPMTILPGVGAAASLEFGAGALDCEDLYVTSSGAMRRYEMGTAAGAAVPWH